VIYRFEGTVGPLVEDRLTVLFNDPLPTEDPAGQAVRLALAMREAMTEVVSKWRRTGFNVDFGVGIDLGYATLGTVGFEGKTEYGAIGTVVHLAGRLAELARECQILISGRVQLATEQLVESSSLGEQMVAGLPKPVQISAVVKLRSIVSTPTLLEERRTAVDPLSDREREVVSLIVRGCTNREIAERLVIAEGTAVRHVANILNKLDLHTRAQVAVWAVEHAREAV
jgi:DNA-binding CsgD family transcriptional regulator